MATTNPPILEPTPRLVLRVGITGHRTLPPAAARALEDQLGAVLAELRSTCAAIAALDPHVYAGEPPVLRAISPLADGADRLFAAKALELGYELQCPLPFPRAEYAKDFDARSQAIFHDFLGKATACLELDGDRIHAAEAYETVGLVLLQQCDVLIAVWDGAPARGQGGTEHIVSAALRQEVPVVRLAPDASSPPSILTHTPSIVPAVFDQASALAMLQGILGPAWASKSPAGGATHAGHDDADQTDGGSYFFGATRPSPWLPPAAWRAFLWAFAPRSKPSPRPPEPPPGPFDEPYHRADEAANHYSALHRGSVVATNSMGALAVLLALAGGVVDRGHAMLWGVLEVITMLTLIVMVRRARRERWHTRALDCRFLAESFRQARFLHPLGWSVASSRPRAHDSYGDPSRTWMNWRFRAAVRAAGLPSTVMTPQYVAACRDAFEHGMLGGQLQYHINASDRWRSILHKLHNTTMVCFVIAFIAAGWHVAEEFAHWMSRQRETPATTLDARPGPQNQDHAAREDHGAPTWGLWLTFLAAGLPAVGAAAHAVGAAGEFHRLAQRSDAMAGRLHELRRQVLATQGQSSASIAQYATLASSLMMDEVCDWRILCRQPPIHVP